MISIDEVESNVNRMDESLRFEKTGGGNGCDGQPADRRIFCVKFFLWLQMCAFIAGRGS
ncbi:MAG TPA: hypothetical protein VII90_07145 [Anaerolineales bacterium]